MCIRDQPVAAAVELMPWAVPGVCVMVRESSEHGVIESVDEFTGECQVRSNTRADSTIALAPVYPLDEETLERA